MQELLGRLRALDPEASAALRVIACFDELVVGGVNIHGLLAAAASLAGCDAGTLIRDRGRAQVVAPSGESVQADAPPAEALTVEDDRAIVWLARIGSPHANDELILERLALALRLRADSAATDTRRDIAVLVDRASSPAELAAAHSRQKLDQAARYRVAVAPLFAVWGTHPRAREDVVSSSFGPLHTLILPADITHLEATPVGIGRAAVATDLAGSFETALLALRLAEPPARAVVLADEFGGLLDLLAGASDATAGDDVAAIARIAGRAWGVASLDAITRTSGLREAARAAGVHHSTMTTRVATITDELGFDPLAGLGRARAGMAFLLWRLRTSTGLALPAPEAGYARLTS